MTYLSLTVRPPLRVFVAALLASVAVFVELAPLATAQEILSIITAPKKGTSTDYAADISSDFNGNGTKDIAIVWEDSSISKLVFSAFESSTGAVISSFPIGKGNAPYFKFKTGDVTGDGYPDIVASNWYADECVRVLDGRTGRFVAYHVASSSESWCGDVFDVVDLNGDRRHEIVAFDTGHTEDDSEVFDENGIPVRPFVSSIVVLSHHSTSRLRPVCWLQMDPRWWGYAEALLGGPDRNKDGVKDIFVGFPNASNRAGVLLVANGSTCAHLATDTNTIGGSGFGRRILLDSAPDQNGRQDYQVHSANSIHRYSGLTGTRVESRPWTPPGDLNSSLSTTGDLNGDGITDLLASQPLASKLLSFPNSHAVLLSGKTGALIGAIGTSRLTHKIGSLVPVHTDLLQFAKIVSQELSSPSFDANRDGIPDVVVRADNVSFLGGGGDRSLYLVISGACPKKAEVDTWPRHGWKVPLGEYNFDVSTWVCGQRYPLTSRIVHNGAIKNLSDNGANGDRVSGDNAYGTRTIYTAGLQAIGIAASIGAEVPLTSSTTLVVKGVQSYRALGVSSRWISTTDATALPGLSSSSTVEVTPPFPIQFFGDEYTKLFVHRGGSISLGTPLDLVSPIEPLSDETQPRRVIAPYHSDMSFGPGGRVSTKTVGQPGRRQFVVTWEGLRHNQLDPAIPLDVSRLTFQLVLHEGNPTILMNYYQMVSSEKHLASGGNGICRIQENDFLMTTHSLYETLLPSGSSVAFFPASSGNEGPHPPGNPPDDDNNEQDKKPTPSPDTFKVSLSSIYSPRERLVKLDVLPMGSSQVKQLDLSQDRCVVEIHGGKRVPGLSTKLSKLATFPLRKPSLSRRATNMPGLARQIVAGARGKKVVVSVSLRATVRCPDGRVAASNQVVINPPKNYRGKQLKPEAWVTRVAKNLR